MTDRLPINLELDLRVLGVLPKPQVRTAPPAAPIWDGKGECPF